MAGGDHGLFRLLQGEGLAGEGRVVLSEEERPCEHRARSGGDGDEDRPRGFGREAAVASRAVDHEEGKDGHARPEETGAGAAVALGEANLAGGDHAGAAREKEESDGDLAGCECAPRPERERDRRKDAPKPRSADGKGVVERPQPGEDGVGDRRRKGAGRPSGERIENDSEVGINQEAKAGDEQAARESLAAAAFKREQPEVPECESEGRAPKHPGV